MAFNAAEFYGILRNGKLLGPVLEPSEFQGVNAILEEALARKWPISWIAYALSTAYHETGHTMQPIKEYGGPKYFTRMYDPLGNRPSLAKSMGNTTPGDGIKYCGRGFVQLTWKVNYEKCAKALNIPDLVKYPDKAMDIEIAAKILGYGMETGLFTGKSFRTYLPSNHLKATEEQFTKARKIINGTDKDNLLADYAIRFQNALASAGM